MSPLQGARARARADITSAITAEARRQLAREGAPSLSLRAVARELGMVSSAVYRYVPSRDDLLTLLIIEAYDALGAAAEAAAAASAGRPAVERWVTTAMAVRSWAAANPHEYALIYGSPVPGYEAPTDTVGPAARVSLAIVGVVTDAWANGELVVPDDDVDPVLRPDLAALRDAAGTDAPDIVLLRTLTAWTQLFGLVSFELFGQTHGLIEHHEELFAAATGGMAAWIGLR